MKANCICCDATFEAESITWASHRETQEDAAGCRGRNPDGSLTWYGADNADWAPEDCVEFEKQVGGVGTFGRCPKCANRKIRAEERASRYSSPCAPDWFDPGYAGERWSEDDY